VKRRIKLARDLAKTAGVALGLLGLAFGMEDNVDSEAICPDFLRLPVVAAGAAVVLRPRGLSSSELDARVGNCFRFLVGLSGMALVSCSSSESSLMTLLGFGRAPAPVMSSITSQ
jgi:hypothetical protein